MMRQLRDLAVVLGCGLLSHCQCDGKGKAVSIGGGTAEGVAAVAPEAANTGVVPPVATMAEGLPIAAADRGRRVLTKDLTLGAGAAASLGRQVDFHYVMRLVDGQVVEDSHGGAAPRSLEIGNGAMLPPVEEAMIGMRPGGKRRILVPAFMAFGEHGVGKQIPPNADLDVEVEMLRVE